MKKAKIDDDTNGLRGNKRVMLGRVESIETRDSWGAGGHCCGQYPAADEGEDGFYTTSRRILEQVGVLGLGEQGTWPTNTLLQREAGDKAALHTSTPGYSCLGNVIVNYSYWVT